MQEQRQEQEQENGQEKGRGQDQDYEQTRRLHYLLNAYVHHTYTQSEFNELFGYIHAARSDEDIYAFMEDFYKKLPIDSDITEPDWEKLYSGIASTTPKPSLYHNLLTNWLKYSVAAIVVLGFGVGALWLYMGKKSIPLSNIASKESSMLGITPGSAKAVLTLGDGQTVQLDSTGSRQIVQDGATITKSGAKLQYGSTGNNKPNVALIYNTLRTPRGGEYHLLLSDGTGVWLNAQSSITYPVVFSGMERTVSTTGEVYFEVKADPQHPFIVKTAGQITRDIGTAFNINAYFDRPGIKTTLFEGTIEVNNKLLEPGQQATVENNAVHITSANTDEVGAWRNGLFYFDNENFENVMKTLARWYDIDITYQGPIPKRHFEGYVPRNYNLGDLLAVLKASDIHFRLSGRTLIVG